MKRLIIIGAGGYGQTVSDVAETLGEYDEILFLDDNKKDEKVIGKCNDYEKFISDDTYFYPAFGNNELRLEFIEKLEKVKANIPKICDKSAYISKRAYIEKGTVVLPGAIIMTDTKVEKGCIINCAAIVDHGCVIEKGAHICLGTIVKAENRIPEKMKTTAGEVIENRTYSLNGDK